MIDMKSIKFYLKIIIVVLITLSKVTFFEYEQNPELYVFDEEEYVLLEKNIIAKSFISYIYKDNNNNYMSKIYDYYTNKEMNIFDVIKEDKAEKFRERVNELIFLKYPKFISEELINENVKKSFLFRDNELVIYFNDYELELESNEILYLKVNYNEIKDCLNFSFILDKEYENESGYNFTNSKKSVAFTFDDSPNKNKTNKILKVLKDNHFHATFFVVGEKAENNLDLLISIKNSGNEIGSHSYSHQNYNKLTNNDLINDYKKVNDITNKLFQENIKLLRPPYGIYKDEQLNVLDVSFILWNMDTLDWKYKNSNYIINYVVNNIKDGDIILFHDSYDTTVNAVKKLLPILYSKGYQVMSVSELAKLKNVKLETNKVYNKIN